MLLAGALRQRHRQAIRQHNGVALTEDEYGTVRENLASSKHAVRDIQIFDAGITTRLRRSNLLGLRGDWFDADGWLHIGKRMMKGKRGQKKSLSIPVPTWTQKLVGERTGQDVLLFPSERSKNRAIWWVEDILERAVAKGGVRPFSLHDLRTTGNTWLSQAGVDELTRRALMGHSIIDEKGQVTVKGPNVIDIYTKGFVKQLRDAVDVYDQIRKRNGWKVPA